ncbi:MAG: hypothetical protein HZB11_02005 [Candidatus Yonathbacteria bacterium]|nr:hypothetical protein [Candidatus Yonathbacteria bacterium]
MTRIAKLFIVLGLSALFANTAEAASLFFVPATNEYGVGKEISVDLKVDSEGAGINAAQATIRFPKDTLAVKSVDKTDSTLNFWLDEPTFSNEDGVISFTGGITSYGISGASLQVLRIVFISKGSGSAPVTINDAAVTASDGSGTNILSKTNNAVFTISPEAKTPTPAVPAPKQITREAAPASGLPEKPILTIPFYPDQTLWYNLSNIFAVNWVLPRDVSGVATALNKQPNYAPEESEGLFDSKMFQALSDGTWYLHVRFKNNIGWGVTAHYRLAVDTKAPLPFEITPSESEINDNPTPIFTFNTGDALSGVREYRIRMDNENWVTIPAKNFKGTWKLAATGPGKHKITVSATDTAGNSIENNIDHEILPLAAPTFTFVTEKLFSDEATNITTKGTALPSTEILLSLKQGDALIESKIAPVDAHGNWEFTFDNPLRNGSYVASIQNRDTRGALSFVVNSAKIKVTGKYTNVIITLIVVLLGALVTGFWFYERRRKRTALRIDVAESDTAKVFKIIETDIEKLKRAQDTPTSADEEFITQQLGENVKKMGGYIKEEIKKAKE